MVFGNALKGSSAIRKHGAFATMQPFRSHFFPGASKIRAAAERKKWLGVLVTFNHLRNQAS